MSGTTPNPIIYMGIPLFFILGFLIEKYLLNRAVKMSADAALIIAFGIALIIQIARGELGHDPGQVNQWIGQEAAHGKGCSRNDTGNSNGQKQGYSGLVFDRGQKYFFRLGEHDDPGLSL